MSYIFMDESWDLWFDKKWSSKYFIITFLFQKQEKTSELIMKKLFHRLKGKKVKIRWWVFHCCKEDRVNIIKALRLIEEKDLSCMTLILNKDRVYTKLQNQKHILYNWVVNILIDTIINKNIIPKNDKITFVASRRETSKTLNENFLSYLKSKHKDQPNINFEIRTPYQEKWLQVADILSYAVYQKYERNDNELYDIIEKLILEERRVFN